MKPPYLNKLSKKQPKKEYTRQWREAIRANSEIYLGNITNDQLHEVILQQEQEINIKSIALTEHFGKIEELKKDLIFITNHENKERSKVELELIDTQEALSRSRQLRGSLQELADRKHGEKAKIEDMAQSLFIFCRSEVYKELTDVCKQFSIEVVPFDKEWTDLEEEAKDHFRVNATHIISHLPTDENRKTTTEGSPE